MSGGFNEEDKVLSTQPDMNLDGLKACHEEADTRIILHAIHCKANTITVSAQDTDVLLLLMALCDKLHCYQLWIKSSTSKKRKYIPIKDIIAQLIAEAVRELLAFHALIGCDSTSYFAGH